VWSCWSSSAPLAMSWWAPPRCAAWSTPLSTHQFPTIHFNKFNILYSFLHWFLWDKFRPESEIFTVPKPVLKELGFTVTNRQRKIEGGFYKKHKTRVVDPDWLNKDPDPAFLLNPDTDPVPDPDPS
jgi:hypothetical protein